MNKKHFHATLLAAAMVGGLGIPATSLWSPVPAVHAEEDLPDVPTDAKKVEESSTGASFHVPAKGQVWLYDLTERQVVHSITVNPGNTYSFDTKTDTVLVDKTHGPKMDLDPKHTYRIYYVDWATRKHASAEEKESDALPKSAKHVAEAKNGENLIFKAPAPGTVYLYDRSNGELVNVFRVHKDDSFVVEPKHNRVVNNDKIILKNANLKTDVDYQLYYVAKS